MWLKMWAKVWACINVGYKFRSKQLLWMEENKMTKKYIFIDRVWLKT